MNINYPQNTDKQLFSDYIGNQIQLSQIMPPEEYGKFSDTYITNNSVSPETAYLFFMAVERYKYNVRLYHGDDFKSKVAELIAFILTQEIKIIVRHDR